MLLSVLWLRRRMVLLVLLRVLVVVSSSSVFLLDLPILLLKLRLLDGHLGRAIGPSPSLLTLTGGSAETSSLLLRSRRRSGLLLLRLVGSASHLRDGDGDGSGRCWRGSDGLVDDGEVPEPARAGKGSVGEEEKRPKRETHMRLEMRTCS